MKRANRITRINKALFSLIGTCILSSTAALAGPVQHTFATQLEEVRTGHFNGTEYLTIQIPGNVGPANCRGNVLKVDKKNLPPLDQQAIETVALTAMLNEDEVLITIGLDRGDCVDGKPTLVDLHVVSRSARH